MQIMITTSPLKSYPVRSRRQRRRTARGDSPTTCTARNYWRRRPSRSPLKSSACRLPPPTAKCTVTQRTVRQTSEKACPQTATLIWHNPLHQVQKRRWTWIQTPTPWGKGHKKRMPKQVNLAPWSESRLPAVVSSQRTSKNCHNNSDLKSRGTTRITTRSMVKSLCASRVGLQ